MQGVMMACGACVRGPEACACGADACCPRCCAVLWAASWEKGESRA